VSGRRESQMAFSRNHSAHRQNHRHVSRDLIIGRVLSQAPAHGVEKVNVAARDQNTPWSSNSEWGGQCMEQRKNFELKDDNSIRRRNYSVFTRSAKSRYTAENTRTGSSPSVIAQVSAATATNEGVARLISLVSSRRGQRRGAHGEAFTRTLQPTKADHTGAPH